MSNANALMKGHTWAKGKKKLKYPAIAEYKLDEIRLDVRYEPTTQGLLFRSYADKPLWNLAERFSYAFDHYMGKNRIDRLDLGVLVNRSFNDTYRFTRSKNGVPLDLEVRSVEFILFDCPMIGDIPFRERAIGLDNMAKDMVRHGINAIRPPRTWVHDEDSVMLAYGQAREQGYEGLMVKDLQHEYQVGKRTYGWLKVKPEEDADGIIAAINQATSIEGVPLDRAGSVTIAVEDGSTADCAGIDHDLGRLMLAHPEQFLGKWAEFKYMERDRQGGYRHPRFNRIREDKA